MPSRRSGDSRLIDWTGERCVPWAPDVQVIYEHYHRYLWAQPLVSGARVLDLGSGEGFGAALLAEEAREVVGIDVDALTVEHSRLNYTGDNLDFRVASATDLAQFSDGAFDAVIAFEVIEHIADQEAVLAEVARVLDQRGLFIASTPERHAYTEETPANPFHERELSREEFENLLTDRFRSVALFSQRTATGSRIMSLTPVTDRPLPIRLRREGDQWRQSEPPEPLYLVAVATNGEAPDLPRDSTLSDFELQLMRVAEHDARQAEAEALHARQHLDSEVEAARVRERQKLIGQVVDRTREVDRERMRVQDAQQALARLEESVTWQLFQRVRGRLYGLIGDDSVAARALGSSLRFIGRLTARPSDRDAAAATKSWERLSLPRFAEPDVSIVVPVYSGAHLTERCLRAVLHSSDGVAYEVVIVDDAADEDTKTLLEAVDGARIVVNDQNLGFLRSVNAGAAQARGHHLVLLNNDTEPQPGWLRALVDRAEAADDVGVVASKLVYPGGGLQEAGGIVWQDGVPWNYGHGQDPGAPEYNYVREVDYGSAAALLVRSSLWQEVGGFDERFAPGYFEDTDLCFAARARGWRVLYEPRAVVLHHEGGAMGTDLTSGGKRHQVLNQPKFVEKWRETLVHQPADRGLEHARLASDRRPGPQVLVVDHRVPMPDRDSGSLRMWHLLEGLLELGCRVSFLPDDRQAHEPYTTQLQSKGIEMLVGQVSVPQHLAALSPRLKLCVLSRPYVAARYLHLVREHAPGAVIAYDTVDLHFLREERRARSGLADPRVAETFRELESALAEASDVTLVVSEEEREHLHQLVPDVAVCVVPNANEIPHSVPGPAERHGLLFVGSFEHSPNVDAAVLLADQVMPRVWDELEEMKLTIVGANAPTEVTQLASPRINVAGWVKDIGPLLRESLAMVAPLSYGAGMKGKVTQSLAAGLPVVTTTIGAEGLDVADGRDLLIADGSEGLANRIIRLSNDPDLWRRLSANGQAVVERVCSPAVQLDALRSLLEMGGDRELLEPLSADGDQA